MWPGIFLQVTPFPHFFFPHDLDNKISDEGGSEDGDSEGLGLEEFSEDVEEDLEGEDEEDREEDRNSEDDGVVAAFSSVKVSEEVEKGRAVKNQIGVCLLLLLACFSEFLHQSALQMQLFCFSSVLPV